MFMYPQITPKHSLADDEIRRDAPSVFATHAGDNTSSRYAYLPSYEVVRAMRNVGLHPVQVREGTKRNPAGREFAMHEIRFRRADHMEEVATVGLGGLIPEAVFRNSHDTTSPLVFEAGMFRVLCLNGMTAPGTDFGSFKLRHAGNVSKRTDEMFAGMALIRANMTKVLDVAEQWKKIQVSPDAARRFVDRALGIRGTTLAVDPERVLRARRPGDAGSDLWSIFNRVQENLTKGGMSGRRANGRRSHLRSIGSLRADVDFNRGLWTAASEMAADVTPSVSVMALT